MCIVYAKICYLHIKISCPSFLFFIYLTNIDRIKYVQKLCCSLWAIHNLGVGIQKISDKQPICNCIFSQKRKMCRTINVRPRIFFIGIQRNRTETCWCNDRKIWLSISTHHRNYRQVRPRAMINYIFSIFKLLHSLLIHGLPHLAIHNK